MLAVLEGRDGRAELGLAEHVEGEEAENAVLHERDADLTPGEARALLEVTQARMLAALRALDPGLLVSQRAHIAGNTYEHVEEHAGWVRALVGAPA